MSLYLAATPRFEFIGFFPPIFQLGAALAVGRHKHRIGWLLFAVVCGFFIWLAIMIFFVPLIKELIWLRKNV